jgi:triphosphoribosyl-dephospho-CoA synthase
MLTPESVAAAAQLACLLEASAEKPGNVTPTHRFHNMAYEDFLRSAIAIGPTMGAAGELGVGETVRNAVQATRRWTQANTNLGIILLFAPLAKAALQPGELSLRERQRSVLRTLTVEDAIAVYAAIRLANPGGLAEAVEDQDVREEPTLTLREAMALAVERDAIAAEYLNDYAVIFERGLLALRAARERQATERDAIVQVFLTLLAAAPDTLIARKLGPAAAQDVSDQAKQVMALGGVFSEEGRRGIAQFDAQLRDVKNRLNPGTTADLVAAILFANMLDSDKD